MVSFESKGFNFSICSIYLVFLVDYDLEEAMKLIVRGKKRYIIEMESFFTTNDIPFSMERPEFWKYSRLSDKIWVTFQLQSFRGVCYLMKKYENRCFLQYHREVSEMPRQYLSLVEDEQTELQPYEDLESYEARIGGR